ncbi:DUF7310 family coiled-coil domain-containing protein [Halogeometricum luteum]|uniref:DUF7310 domain-containing protein n=1 Tax=Halogeometricum luteum TaxID=2950537 RepID=A0ABU2FYF7_9EURY|nr:hypothetical protein [Halogeometricum sp. S3BR5-2]MDS0293564.1 hypothetical protein [Halogeometricum sp. S3BR5-2]
MPNDRTDIATLAARLDAVERALTDGERAGSRGAAREKSPPTAPETPNGDAADDGTDETLRRLERRVEELTAELDAVRGLLGGVEAVNDSVERRADLALAAVERLTDERAVEGESDGLVAERLPDGDDGVDDSFSAVDAAEAAAETGDENADSDSLAARLRGAL